MGSSCLGYKTKVIQICSSVYLLKQTTLPKGFGRDRALKEIALSTFVKMTYDKFGIVNCSPSKYKCMPAT